MEFDGDLDSKAREIEDLKKSEDELTQQAAMRWADSQLDPHIPQPPFFLQLVGGIGKGKTTIILNLVREYQRVNTFARVIYLSPSGLNDAKLRMFLTADNSNMEYTEENLTALMQEIEEETAAAAAARPGGSDTATPASGSQGLSPAEVKQRIQRKVPPTLGAKDGINQTGLAGTKDKIKTKEELAKEARKRVSNRTLIIADDATGSILTKRNSPFVQFLVSIRHQNASVILCTHSNSSLAAQIRNITTAQILFEPGTGTELKSLVQDIGGVSDKTLESMLSHVAQIPHGFVMVDKKRPFRDRFVVNFRELLDPHAFRSPKEGGAEGQEMYRSGGYLPTPAQATAAERRYTEKGIFLQHEAIKLNTGLTPAEKILQEQNVAAKRERQVKSGARTEAFKRAQTRTAIKQKGKKQSLHDRTVTATGAIRSAAYQQNAEARLTSASKPGGVLDAKFQRGVARNVAIATGGRRGIGRRGRRGAGALGPLAQQLAENLEREAELKRQRDQFSRDEEARQAEARQAEFDQPIGPELPEEVQLNNYAKDNPPNMPEFPLNAGGGVTPFRSPPSQLSLDLKSAVTARRNKIIDNQKAAFSGSLQDELRASLPNRTEDDIFNQGEQVAFENQPLSQAEAAAEAAVEPMNVEHDLREDEVPSKQKGENLPPLPPSPEPDPSPEPEPIEEDQYVFEPVVESTSNGGNGASLAPPNPTSSQGPDFGSKPAERNITPMSIQAPSGPAAKTVGLRRQRSGTLQQDDPEAIKRSSRQLFSESQVEAVQNAPPPLANPPPQIPLGGAPVSETNTVRNSLPSSKGVVMTSKREEVIDASTRVNLDEGVSKARKKKKKSTKKRVETALAKEFEQN